jgi:hypothetical protein
MAMPEVGKSYIVKDGNDIWVGNCVGVDFPIIHLWPCCWVADTGYWHDFVRDGETETNECEPFSQETSVTARTWQEWTHPLITEVRGR